MKPVIDTGLVALYEGDSLNLAQILPADSIDAIVTDPPAGIEFMGKAWDDFSAKEATASGTQTEAWGKFGKTPYARGATPRYTERKGTRDLTARENFIASMTDVMAEAFRVLKPGGHALIWALPRTSHWTTTAVEDAGFEVRDVITHHFGSGFPKSLNVAKAIDEEEAAKRWQGWGTALKPASEHWILARKPLIGTVAENVLAHGTGALNVDACRVEAKGRPLIISLGGPSSGVYGWQLSNSRAAGTTDQGRWPANLVLSHADACEDGACAEGCPVAEMDAQSGTLKSGAQKASSPLPRTQGTTFKPTNAPRYTRDVPADSGGASRFFYCAKAPKSDKTAGGAVENYHPTVKNTDLMGWLIKLITPPNGVVLDLFTGSGSTGVAAVEGGFRFVGVERDAGYVQIAAGRLRQAMCLAAGT